MDILILIDKSGSMAGNSWFELIGTVNTFCERAPSGAYFELATFNSIDGFRVEHKGHDLYRPLDPLKMIPTGGTPLNDAIAKLVAMANTTLSDKKQIVILTDGEENSSKEVTTERARALLEECRGKGWDVVFLGVNYDNFQQAHALGNAAAASMAVHPFNLAAASAVLSSRLRDYAQGTPAADLKFSDKDRLAAGEDKVAS